jgi:ethanolamine permease
MAEQRRRAGVEYDTVGDDYLDQRKLQSGSVGWVLLAGLGVAYVISGDFAGWNFGLDEGGFGGLLIATVLMAIMYTCMVLGLAEMASALPVAGAGLRLRPPSAGPLGGFATGTAILIEYAIAPAAIVVFIGGYVEALGLFGLTSGWPVYLACYAIFVGVHLYGVGEALKLMFAITAVAVVALVLFVVAMIPKFDSATSPTSPWTPRLPGRRPSAVRLRGGDGSLRLRHLVLPRRRRAFRWRQRRHVTRRRTCHAGSSPRCSPCWCSPPASCWWPRRVQRRGDPGLRQPAARGASRRLRRLHLDGGLRQLRRSRWAGGQLLLDHLRLLAAALRAVPGRLPAPRAALTSKRHTPWVALLVPAGIGFLLAALTQDGALLINIAVFGATVSTCS